VIPLLPFEFNKASDVESSSSGVRLGILFSSKAIAQILSNPLVSVFVSRVGSQPVLCLGLLIMGLSTLVFSLFDGVYAGMLVARVVQGVSSACVSTAGMTAIANAYEDGEGRAQALGNVLGGVGIGVLVGPVMGSWLVRYGHRVPFLAVSGIIGLLFLIQIIIWAPWRKAAPPVASSLNDTDDEQKKPPPPSYREEWSSRLALVKDPEISAMFLAIIVVNTIVACDEPIIPLLISGPPWHVHKNNTGFVFISATLGYAASAPIIGWVIEKYRCFYSCSIIGVTLLSLSTAVMAYPPNLPLLIANLFITGVSVAMVDTPSMSIFSRATDQRHKSLYSAVFSLSDIAFSIGYIVGPLSSASIAGWLGFKKTYIVFGIVCALILIPLSWASKMARRYYASGDNWLRTELLEVEEGEREEKK
jgi:DHA1 family solute carrier family 18 vesicular amine transporter 1/2